MSQSPSWPGFPRHQPTDEHPSWSVWRQSGSTELAEPAQVSTDTITRLAGGEELKPRTIEALRRALEDAGVEFIPANGGGPGVRLKTRPND